MLKLSLTEFSLPKFYQLFGISKVKSAAVSAFRSSYRPGDRSFAYTPPEQERVSLQSLEVITDALLEIMEVRNFPVTFTFCLLTRHLRSSVGTCKASRFDSNSNRNAQFGIRFERKRPICRSLIISYDHQHRLARDNGGVEFTCYFHFLFNHLTFIWLLQISNISKSFRPFSPKR